MKLHLGCGKRYIEGMTHIDLADFPHIDYKASVDNLHMIRSEEVTLIYASHVLEYWDRFQSLDVLGEWFRVLEKGGVLRLSVPNFDSLIKIYQSTGDLEAILGPLYGRMQVGECQVESAYIYHKTVWSESLLRLYLAKAGFREIRNWNWSDIFPAEYDDHSQAYYPHMQKQSGIQVSINLECTK